VSNQAAAFAITECIKLGSSMNLISQSWDFRMLWIILPLQTKLFFLCLFLTAIYMTFSLAIIYLRSRSAARKPTEPLPSALHLRFLKRIHNLRQLHFMFLLVFGVTLTDEVFRSLRAYENSKSSLGALTAAEVADPVLAFAYCCLIIFTSLHLFRWVVSNQLEKTASTSQ
jgi:hypothetical protein